MKELFMTKPNPSPERGVALFFVIIALMLLTAIAAGLMFMTDTETGINANYKQEQQAYFNAKAGLEEVRDRMRGGVANTLSGLPPLVTPNIPPTAAGGVLYLVNQGTDPVAVTPWVAGSTYMDDEFCHEGYTYGGTFAQGASNVRCTAVPAGPTWYTQPVPTSTAPGAGTAAALSYKWVRVTWKQNQAANGYAVDGNNAPNAPTATTPVCWNGTSEVLLNGAVTCQQMTPATTPVFLLTSLAITSTGARRMVQEEVAKAIFPPVPSALTLDG